MGLQAPPGSSREEDLRVEVQPATVEQLRMLIDDPAAFEHRFGLRLVPGYSPFDGALEQALAVLEQQRVPPRWWTHLFVHAPDRALIGTGGYTGPPDRGVVEIGYAIAPAYQGRGLATTAAAQLVSRAAAAGMRRVQAHTLAQASPSTGVLHALGFTRTAEVHDPDDGLVWRWELDLADTQARQVPPTPASAGGEVP